MSLLTDILADLLGSALEIGPSTDRGLVAMFAVAAFLCGGATVIAATISPDFLRGPLWGIGTLIGAILCGAAGLMLSTLHVIRNEHERVFGGWCLAASVAGPMMPLLWLVAR
jgi:hypothetical protein